MFDPVGQETKNTPVWKGVVSKATYDTSGGTNTGSIEAINTVGITDSTGKTSWKLEMRLWLS